LVIDVITLLTFTWYGHYTDEVEDTIITILAIVSYIAVPEIAAFSRAAVGIRF